MNAVAPAVASSPLVQVSAPPVAIGPETTAALLLATAGAIALFWFTVKMAAGFREFRQVTREREEDEESTRTPDDETADAEQSE
ncbi:MULTISPECIES: hypothetical protein [unclassified Haloparvum]|uniref:hypothetical protein n=1 Tax=Haloparvum sp. PAK95 TaxID=3418962 RepID=UPI003D2F4046